MRRPERMSETHKLNNIGPSHSKQAIESMINELSHKGRWEIITIPTPDVTLYKAHRLAKAASPTSATELELNFGEPVNGGDFNFRMGADKNSVSEAANNDEMTSTGEPNASSLPGTRVMDHSENEVVSTCSDNNSVSTLHQASEVSTLKQRA